MTEQGRGKSTRNSMASLLLMMMMMLSFTLAAAEEQQQQQQGRQMNWNELNYLTKPGYSSNGVGPDSDGAASRMVAQAAAKGPSNFQAHSPQSLEGVGPDVNRDGGYSGGSAPGDYGYETSPDSSYSTGTSYGSGYGEDSRLGGFVTALSAFLPIGLFLAAIVPNIITVSAGRRRRADEKEEARAVRDEATFPILDMISSFGVRALQEPECQSKIVCEIGRMGGLPEANAVQRALWLTANYVPERISRLVGMDKIFRQIRSQQCSDLKCSSG